jgi:hypothetical protein
LWTVLLLRISRPFTVAAHDLDLIRLYRLTRVLHFEGDVLDQKGPDFIAETVGIKVTLCPVSIATVLALTAKPIYLERQPRLHFLGQDLRYTAIEVRQDLHRELGLDATLTDQVVKGVRERHADAKDLSVSTG